MRARAVRSAARYVWAHRWGRLAVLITVVGVLAMVGVVTPNPLLYALPDLRSGS